MRSSIASTAFCAGLAGQKPETSMATKATDILWRQKIRARTQNLAQKYCSTTCEQALLFIL